MPEQQDKAFLGVGWSYPLTLDGSGAVVTAEYEEDIRQAVHIILGTRRGERAMRPDFGAGLPELVFEPMNVTTVTLARRLVEEALIQWEPRIDHLTVDVTGQPELGVLNISLEYRIRATNTFYNLVYPFYLTEGRDR